LIGSAVDDEGLKIFYLDLQLRIAALECLDAMQHWLYDIIDIIFRELIHWVLKNGLFII
jgi:hypothetical protein